MDKEEMRKLYPTDEEMYAYRMMGIGKEELSPDVLDFLEMVWREIKEQISSYEETRTWQNRSPVEQAYEKYQNGERPE